MKARQGATRIETRTLWLFVACALVPVAAFALLGFTVVSSELQRLAQQRLDAATKSYGLAILDRLQQIDGSLTRQAQRYLQTPGVAPPQVLRTDQADFRLLDLSRTVRSATQMPVITRTLLTRKRENGADAVLQVAATSAQGSIRMQADVAPRYLWNADAVLLPDAVTCVLTEQGQPLNCIGADGMQTQSGPDELRGEWTLFLSAAYGTSGWRIQMHQPRAAALGALDAFRWILPLAATLAVAIALLLGSIFIRRSHAPLRLLTQAARRIARRDFSQPIAGGSRDEYGRLIRTFNRMAGNLQNQFTLQSSFARIDEIILSHAGAAQAIDSVLPHLPGMLGCNAAGVLLNTTHGHAKLRMTGDDAKPQDDLRLPCDLLARQGVQQLTRHSVPALFARAGITTDRLILCAITVAGTVRGHLVASDERVGPAAMRALQGIAQRIAVAIGNDDYQQALWRQAHLDPLTGLANRLLLQERIAQAIEDGAASGTRGAVLFLDLDRFKSVNDSMGHSIGDVLLQQIAERLAAVAPAGATVARFGGDEFVILIPRASAEDALKHARHVLESLADPCTLRELRYVTHASAGVATFPDHGADADVLLKHADIAMYRAKATGRGTVCLFDGSMNDDAAQRLRMEQRLREALRDGAIRAYFQPKVDATGAIVAVEALARWREPAGFVSPAQFIPVAEETGLIVALGETMLIQACRQLGQWRTLGLSVQHVAVNISLLQLRDPAFPSFIERCLAESGLTGDSLELEVTESLFAEDGHAVAEQLHRLTRLGVRIAIDDFGTGFSSMSRLRDFPITTLKIDRSFVISCSRSREAQLLLKALIDVGHALHLEVVAEGVETTDQRDVLRELACGFMQGFLFAQALSAEDVTRLLSPPKSEPPALLQTG